MARWLVNIFKSIFMHGHIPCNMSDVFIRLLLKNNLKEPCSSENYTPITVATSASKILEKLILNRIREYLNISSNQFGFKPSSSTEDCIFLIMEVINYYRALNTPIFACFIDIKSACDRVRYDNCFFKLIDRNVPKYIIFLLVSWYRSQRLYVKWGSSLSNEFSMKNGIRQGSLLKRQVHVFSVRLPPVMAVAYSRICNRHNSEYMRLRESTMEIKVV